jgi:ketosteroid isomerase-like protein
MSRQNVEIITAMLDRARTDPSALAAVLHETAEFDLAGINPEVEIIDAEDSVVVSIDQWGRGKSSGAAVHQVFWQVWTLREGKAVRVTHHNEKADALASVRRAGR